MNVLILTGKFGMGHYSAAKSIKEEIISKNSKVNVEIVDIVDYMMPGLSPIIYSSFDLLVKRANRIYNYFYKHTADSDYNTSLPFINKFILKLEALIYRSRPDLVISTLPLCSMVMSEYKRRYNSTIPLLTCITDVSIHNEWISPYTNLYMVANDKVKANLLKNGVDSKNIVITGIPVKADFRDNDYQKPNFSRKEKTVLIMGGGLGLIPLKKSFYSRLSKVKNLRLIVITANNKKAYSRLKNKYDNIEVIGYTSKVDEYMAKADLIITKAGGITTFESIYSSLPLLILYPFLEQERSNSYFIEENHIGEIAWDKSIDMADRVLDLINDEKRLEEMQSNMDRLKSNIDHIDFLNIIESFSEAV